MIHVLPLNDLHEHQESSTCPCCPLVEEENGELIVIHNAYDGRVAVEIANEILSECQE